ncbi:TRAP transporter substrate-binding protein DctP [Candidatus Neomarinimicrobiota bacterium]
MTTILRTNQFIWHRMLLLICILITVAGGAAKDTKIVIKMATIAPDGSPWVMRMEELADRWRELSDGLVQIRLYPNGVSGDESDIVRKMRIKMLQGAALTAKGLGEIDPGIWGLCQPLLVENGREFEILKASVDSELRERYWQKGYIVLGWTNIGWVRWFGVDPIRTPDDLRKTKLFMWEGSNTEGIWKVDGFRAINLSIHDVMIGLETGLINSLAMVPLSAAVSQWFGLATYMTDLPWASLIGGVVIRLETWESIPIDIREKLLVAAAEMADDVNQSADLLETQAIETMVSYGLTVVETTPAEKALWSTWLEGHREKLRGVFVDEAMYDLIFDLRKDLRENGMTNEQTGPRMK